MYALYLYLLGLSFRNTAKALDPFVEKRSHVAVWNWVQLFNPNKFYLKNEQGFIRSHGTSRRRSLRNLPSAG